MGLRNDGAARAQEQGGGMSTTDAMRLGVQLMVARALGDVAEFMRRDGVAELIGDENVFATSTGAIARLAAISPHPDDAPAAPAHEARDSIREE
jgi:hypothetical protein